MKKNYPGNRDQRRTIEVWKIEPKETWKNFARIFNILESDKVEMERMWLANALTDLEEDGWIKSVGTGDILYTPTRKGLKYLRALPDEYFKPS